MQKHKKVRKNVKGKTEGTLEEEGDDNDEDKGVELDLTQDEYIDPTPFAFKPYHLESSEAMGGINGLLTGLGVDSKSGLGIGGRTSEPTKAPSTVVTNPASEKAEAVKKSTHEGAAFSSSVEDRQRVYCPNVLPPRRSKSLLELMRLALKDRVLVSPSHIYAY